MSSATLAARASPHSSATRCRATSIPAVMPALDASGPSTTNTRLSMTSACGARVRSIGRSSWWVVQRRAPSKPARAASRVPEQIVTRRCGVSASRSAPLRRSLSHRAAAAISGVTRVTWAVGWPTTTTQVGVSSSPGNGTRSPSASPTDVGGEATGPAKRRRKRGGSPRDSRCRLARRKASAGPAMSSSRELGTMTKRTSMSWARVIMGRKTSESSIHRTGAAGANVRN